MPPINTHSTPDTGSLANDVDFPAHAQDTISSVSWSPVANHLAAASWDGKVRIYDVNAHNLTAKGAAMFAAAGPVFDCDWAKDGTMVAAGGADKSLHILHLPTGQQVTRNSHEKPIRAVRFVEVPNSNTHIVASGSWDKTVKLWDFRQQGPVASLTCDERVYSMDSKSLLLVIATAERRIHLVDLRNPTVFSQSLESPIKYQIKVVTAFPDGTGWATGSIEGRCGMNTVEKLGNNNTDFSFRCHRAPQDPKTRITQVYSINDIQFHPVQHGVFTTAGSDGAIYFWDRPSHSRLQTYPSIGNSVTTTRFNHDGTLFAYALGYDWSKGCAANKQEIETKLKLHRVTKKESTPKEI